MGTYQSFSVTLESSICLKGGREGSVHCYIRVGPVEDDLDRDILWRSRKILKEYNWLLAFLFLYFECGRPHAWLKSLDRPGLGPLILLGVSQTFQNCINWKELNQNVLYMISLAVQNVAAYGFSIHLLNYWLATWLINRSLWPHRPWIGPQTLMCIYIYIFSWNSALYFLLTNMCVWMGPYGRRCGDTFRRGVFCFLFAQSVLIEEMELLHQ